MDTTHRQSYRTIIHFHRSSDKHQHRHGGSNVTYLTGMFQHFLPDMRHTLRDNMQKAFRRADWADDLDRLGIRSVQYLSFEKAGLKAHMEGVRARKEAVQEKQKFFVVYPDEESKRHTQQQQTDLNEDGDSDEAVARYLHGSEGSTIVAYISLSDRNNFAGTYHLMVLLTSASAVTIVSYDQFIECCSAGGEILARRIAERPKKRPVATRRPVEDIPQEEEDIDPELGGWDDVHAAEEAVFDISGSNINRFTPEKNSALYIRPGAGCGMKPVSVGARKLLLIEFWPYVDAAIGASRPRLDDAVSWPQGGDDL